MYKTLLPSLLALCACGEPEKPIASPAVADTREAMIYVEGDGIQACGKLSAARGQALTLIAARLDLNRRSLDQVDTELTVTDPEGRQVPVEATWHTAYDERGDELGQARTYLARFSRTGTHQVTAALGDGTTLSRGLQVVEQAGVALGERGRTVVTQLEGDSCSEDLDWSSWPALGLNQELQAALVPVSAYGEVLAGELDLEFSGPVSVRPQYPELPVQRLGRYVFTPTQAGQSTLTVYDRVLQQATELSFAVEPKPATCAASP